MTNEVTFQARLKKATQLPSLSLSHHAHWEALSQHIRNLTNPSYIPSPGDIPVSE